MDADCMGEEDISCMTMQNCFIDTALKAKLGAVKTPTLATLNDIIESHEAGKKAANLTASANAVKIKGDKGKPWQQSVNGKRDQISNAECERRKKILGKCFRCGKIGSYDVCLQNQRIHAVQFLQ